MKAKRRARRSARPSRNELEARWREAQDALDAIQAGRVEAVIAHTPAGDQLYTLESEEKPYRVFIEHMDQGAMTVDRQGLVVYANTRFAEMVAAPTDRIMGSHAGDWFLGMSAALDRIVRGPDPVIEEVALRARDGREIPVEVRATSLPALSGSIHRALLVADLTAQHEQRERLRAANAELERRVAQRTKQLMESNRELEQFVHSASHDLRAPLRALDGFAQELARTATPKLSEEERDSLDRVRRATLQMKVLLDALLELSRISRGEIKPEAVDVSAMAKEIADGLAQTQPARHVEVRVQPALVVKADPALLRSALANLLENAWKFTSKREKPRIQVTGERIDGHFTLHVADNGVGFDMAYADKLFTPFSRLHSAADFPGTGVGLVSVLRVAQRHGGRAWGEGKVDAGATFHLEIDEEAGKA